MSTTGNHDAEDKMLWQRFRNDSEPRNTQAEVDANLLASYLDGAASGEEQDTVEAGMAADPELLASVEALRGLVAQKAEPAVVSADLLNRIQESVKRTANAEAGKVLYLSWWQSVAAAAAVIAISFCGYFLGEGSTQQNVQTAFTVSSILDADLQEQDADVEGLFLEEDDDSMEGLL